MKEALLYEKLKEKKVRCNLCNHRCLIMPGKRGICSVRENKEGTLFTLVFGKSISEAIDPIEKKPLYHFLPGSFSLSVATVGCNFRCDNCQNWQISQGSKNGKPIQGYELSPERIVEDAKKNNCASISYTYTEPTIFFEYAYSTMKLAKKYGLKNVFVSNGYMSPECLKMAEGYLDAINVDLKFFDDESYKKYCGSHLTPVLENMQIIKKMGVWLEVTTLAVPALSDSREMFEKIAKFIYDKLGPETPWHISRFSGDISYKLDHVSSTPLKTLKLAHKIGLKAGLKYVYLGNVPADRDENTYCPKCKTEVIKRLGFETERKDNEGFCPKCKYKLDFIL